MLATTYFPLRVQNVELFLFKFFPGPGCSDEICCWWWSLLDGLYLSLFCLSAAVPDLEPHKLHLVGGGGAHKAKVETNTGNGINS